jgi:hypothetical protein
MVEAGTAFDGSIWVAAKPVVALGEFVSLSDESIFGVSG